MSDDIYLACIRGKDTVLFKREIFDEIFLPHCTDPDSYRSEPGFMEVEYEDGGGASIYIQNESADERQARQEGHGVPGKSHFQGPAGDPAYIDNLGIDHFGGEQFYRDLYALADRVGAMIFAAPEDSRVIVTRDEVLKEIPEDFLGMENACVVHNPAELEKAICGDD